MSHADQWVVTRRPSSRPACASRNAPLHTEVTRRALAAAVLSQAMRRSSAIAAAVPVPPATRSVSMGPRREARSVPSESPDEVVTGWPDPDTSAVA